MKNIRMQQAHTATADGLNHCLKYHIEREDEVESNNIWEGNIEKETLHTSFLTLKEISRPQQKQDKNKYCTYQTLILGCFED